MIAKAVDAAAPCRERDAWYERRAHWEGTARRRQEARAAAAAAPLHSVVHAQGAAAGVFGRTGVARWFGGSDAREENGRSNRRRRGDEDRGRGDEDDDGFRLDKMQTVLAVAVMLVMAVIKIRGLR